MKLFVFDLETTGTDSKKHGIHQISGEIIIDGEVRERFDYKVLPAHGAEYDPKALAVCGLTEDIIRSYPHMLTVYPSVLSMLCKYIDMGDDQDKFFIVGYNVNFDAAHFVQWFRVNNGFKHFKNLFWFNVIDVMVLATVHLMHRRHIIDNFKQGTVAKYLGIEVDDSKLHDGVYDIYILLQIYNIVCNKY